MGLGTDVVCEVKVLLFWSKTGCDIYLTDILSKEERSERMRRIRSKGTRIERLLGKALWAEGLRYRKNNPKVLGKPDFTFRRQRVAVFCDSEFWHGKDWKKNKTRFKSNLDYWIPKIEGNIRRDREVTRRLKAEGWTVLRFWTKDVDRDTDYCVSRVIEAVSTELD